MIDLIGKRKYFFALSILIFIAGLVGYLINGIELDIQFQGGTIIQMQMPDDNYDTDKAVTIVKNTINKKVTVQKSSTINVEKAGEKLYLMVLNIASEDTLNEEQRSAVKNALMTEFNVSPDAEFTVNSIEPFIGNEIKTNALYAIFWSSLLIILYVWWRFRVMNGLPAGIIAVIALVHDVFVMLAVYILFRIPLNDSFVAAILTVIGYSINDTVVIYDRIRENSKLMKKTAIAQLVNTSVIQTMDRSINTTITVLLCIVTVFIFASVNNIQSIKEFTFPLIIGLVSGVYSTVFIASSLYVIWMEHKLKKKVAIRAAKSKA